MASEGQQRTNEVAIDVFGGIRASRDGVVVRIGGRRQQLLLAVLAIDVGHVVPFTRLVDLIWTDTRSSSNSFHSARMGISRIRSVLGAGSIITDGSGYRLDVEPMSISSVAFGRTVERAAALRRSGEEAAAIDEIDRALLQWTGPPFAGLEHSSVVVAESIRLDELHRSARQMRADALLEIGRLVEAIAAASDLMLAFPLSERPCRTAMLALHGSGRSVDAVRCYQSFRSRLAAASGLVPSDELQRIEQEILGAAEGIEHVTSSLAPASEMTLRHNLAHRSDPLFGRSSDVEAVTVLAARRHCLTILGTGGIGKTSVALDVAWQLLDRAPDGVWWCDLAQVPANGDAAQVVAAVLNVPRRSNRSSVEDVLAYCQRRQLVLILDNCEHVIDSVSTLVRRLQPTAPGVTVIATSREPLGIAGEQIYPLGPLDGAGHDSASVALFQQRASEVVPQIEWAAHRSSIESICRSLGGLPLAIELAAGRVRSLAPSDIEAQVGDLSSLLRGSRRSNKRHRTIDATIRWSYELLTPAEQQLFQRLSVFSGSFDLEAARQVGAADDAADVPWLIERLADKSMLSTEHIGSHVRFRLLEPLRQFAERELGADDNRNRVMRAHSRHYTEWIERWDQRVPADTPEWNTDFTRELSNLRAAVHRSIELGDIGEAERIIVSLQVAHFAFPFLEAGNWAKLVLDHPEGRLSERSPVVAGIAAMTSFWSDDIETFRTYLGIAVSLPGFDPEAFYPAIVEAVGISVFEGDPIAALATLDRINRSAQRVGAMVAWSRIGQHPTNATASDDVQALQSVASETGSSLYEALFHHASGLRLLGSDPEQAAAHATEGITAARRASSRFLLHHNVHILLATLGQFGTLTSQQMVDVSESLRMQRDAGQEVDQWLVLSGIARVLVRHDEEALAHEIHRGLVASPWRNMHDTGLLADFLSSVPDPAPSERTRSLGDLSGQVIVVLDRLIAVGPDADLARS